MSTLLQGDQRPPMVNIELQADCYAGTWAKSAYQENRLEEGDVQEALECAHLGFGLPDDLGSV